MHSLNELFKHIFVITIDRNNGRRSLVDQELKSCDFAYFKGIDIYDFSTALDLKESYGDSVQIGDSLLQNWNVGQVGCWLSHISLLQKIVDEKICKALILEDDIIFNHQRFDDVFCAINSLRWEQLDLLYVGYTRVCAVNQKLYSPFLRNLYRIYYFIKYYRNTPRLYSIKKTPNLILKCFSKGVSRDFDRPGYFYGTHAYVVTYDGACKLLSMFKTIEIPIDMSYAEAVISGKLTALALNRPVFFQNKSIPSSIS